MKFALHLGLLWSWLAAAFATHCVAQAPLGAAAPLAYRTSDKGVRGQSPFDKSLATPCPIDVKHLQESSTARKLLRFCVSEKHVDYDLHTFEFKDSGVATSTTAQQASLSAIRETLQNPGEGFAGAIVIVFVHGWQHNADVCDENLACFRDSLQFLARLEKEVWNPRGSRRRVIGVYLSWRGFESIRLEGYRRVDFFGRGLTAARIGSSRDVKDVLNRLHDETRSANRPDSGIARGPLPTVMITIGHSFGGLITLRSIEDRLKVGFETLYNSQEAAPIVRGLGDLVVLANPAMPAREFLTADRLSRIGSYHSLQRPILISITSSSDWATRYVFPASRLPVLPVVFFRASKAEAPWSASFATTGHYKPFLTHELRLAEQGVRERDPTTNAALPRSKSGSAQVYISRVSCKCSHELFQSANGDILLEIVRQARAKKLGSSEALDLAKEQVFANTKLIPVRGIPAVNSRSPVLNIRAEPTIINGHGDIFNPNFFAFLIRLVSDLTPAAGLSSKQP